MPFENDEFWSPVEPEKRGRHKTFNSALDAALKDLLTEHDEFFDSLADRWREIFPGMPAWPGRYEGGKIFLYVKNAPTNFLMRRRLATIRRALAALPGAPKRIDLRLEIHSQ